MSSTVVAIVVTFNRKELLIECLQAILRQTRPVDKIILIDNASTDGTSELLHSEGHLDNSVVDYVQLAENTGGAGGFYEGMKRAYEAKYDWLWLMDDDGYPAPDALAELLKVSSQLDIIGSAVVLPDDSTQLSWRLRVLDRSGYFKPRTYIKSYAELLEQSTETVYWGLANYFNAILFSRQVVDEVGFVLKELFIWGDDYEYSLRCKVANLKVGTCTKALYFHPEKWSQFSEMKYYYLIRNLIYIYKKYGKMMYSPLMREIYPFYIFFVYARRIPSLKAKYLMRIIEGALAAFQGKLIPY